MNKVKGFNFDLEEDKDVLDHLKTVGNMSDYVKRLVRNDMKNNLDARIKVIVEEYIKDIPLPSNIKNFDIKSDNMNINSVMNILDM